MVTGFVQWLLLGIDSDERGWESCFWSTGNILHLDLGHAFLRFMELYMYFRFMPCILGYFNKNFAQNKNTGSGGSGLI